VSHAYDLKRLTVDGFDEYGEVVVPDCVRVAARRGWKSRASTK
jgi:hypothetical protein